MPKTPHATSRRSRRSRLVDAGGSEACGSIALRNRISGAAVLRLAAGEACRAWQGSHRGDHARARELTELQVNSDTDDDGFHRAVLVLTTTSPKGASTPGGWKNGFLAKHRARQVEESEMGRKVNIVDTTCATHISACGLPA